MQIAKVAFFLFAAIGVAANPVDVDGSGIDAGVSGGEDMNTLITYTGKCTRGRNYKEDTCKFKGQKGRTTIVRCPRFANQRCPRNGSKCTWDSYKRTTKCNYK
ncbi:Antifungal protein [Colletotrichum siamense]|uniref:Antifungal protein n=1 Tax=Colletotrichum siamense TaxID=690259 RepID=A0A9P5BSJ9_COLSI|nr:Antifungal protein [Colletotrichum siamense]KAF4848831.1 Antifungal protein [Colletotrichum siamense]